MNIFKGFKFGKKVDSDESEDESYYTESNWDDESQAITGDAQLLPGDFEKRSILAMFYDMRKDNQFCDVAFLCHGVLFKAHKVVVSSWSRWIRALLSETFQEEAIHIDHFSPDAFGAVLDYMYGAPLTLSVESAEAIIKVVRRLEMQKLEQQCWRYLMTVIDEENSPQLHELADRYDCPPLKLTAWRLIQESVPGYSTSAAARLLGGMTVGKPVRDNGLTGPGEPQVIKIECKDEDSEDDAESGDGEEKLERGRGSEDGSESDEGSEDERPRNKLSLFNYDDDSDGEGSHPSAPRLEQLGPMATAEERVKAWAARLKDVYRDCTPEDGEDYADVNNFKIPVTGADNVRIIANNKSKRKAAAAAAAATAGSEESSVASGVEEVSAAPSGGFFSNLLKRPAAANVSVATGSKSKKSTDKDKSARPVSTKKSKSTMVKSAGHGHIDWAEELQTFYSAVGAKDKISGIPTILVTWAGKEEEMLNALEDKYADVIPKKLRRHLDELYEELEGHTESSFVQQKPRKAKSTR